MSFIRAVAQKLRAEGEETGTRGPRGADSSLEPGEAQDYSKSKYCRGQPMSKGTKHWRDRRAE